MRFLSLLLLVFFLGCVDTEFVDDNFSPVPARVEIEAPVPALEVGGTTQITARYFDESGQITPSATFAFSVSNPAIASVGTDGLVTALSPGSVEIRASSDGTQSNALALVVVADATEPAQIVVAPSSVELQPGQDLAFNATVSNVNGEPLSGVAVTWSSNRPDVATVDADGRVVAVESGTALITASAGSVSSMPATVVVPGQSRQGTFSAAPGSGYNVQGTTTLTRQQNGTLNLMLESDFVTDLGPSMAVYLSNTPGVNGMSLRVGGLLEATGPVSFTVPNVTLDQYDYVVIQCVPFNVTFGSAVLI